jgi:APA family basic amino acid/polyamine antiporter
VAAVHPRTRVPIVAIVLQGAVASLLALTGSYERILGYVVSIDWLFFGLTALALMVFRRRDAARATARLVTVPGHPVTTMAFILGAWMIVVNTIYRFPMDTLAGVALLAAGVPVFFLWRRRQAA